MWSSRASSQQLEADAPSLLAQWKEYSGSDVEAGSITGTIGSAVANAQAAAGNIAEMGSAGARKIGSTVTGVPAAVSGAMRDVSTSLPSGQQLTYATALLGAGGLLLLIAVFIALPVVVLAPAKFAISFTLGCGCVLAGLAVLKGWRAQLAAMLAADRAPFTAGYVGSALATLWAALGVHSYLLSLLFSALQVGALAYYVASYLPGGVAGLRVVSGVAASALNSCLRGGARASGSVA